VPLITLKICQQSQKPFPTSIGGAHLPIPHPVHPSPTRFLRPRPDLESLPTPSSLLAGWFRGVTAAAAPLGPITALQVAVNGAIERAVTGCDRGPTDPERVGVAMAAGAASSVLYSPVDLVVIQQQKLGLDSPGATISAIVKEHGAAGMMRGFWSCVGREAIYTAGYLGLAPIAKDYLTSNVEYFKSNELAASIVGSSIGGTVAAVLTHPVDTSKTCAQSDIAGVKYPNARTALGMVYKEGGIKALYGGGLARTARLCGAFFIINNIREAAIDWKTARAEA
jgi:solute carrier family 25 (mitochondrial 2-oxodicarboxylate transporter), member 21